MNKRAAPRYSVIDGLRGCAILLVLAYHAWEKTRLSIPGLGIPSSVGFLGVEVFFFLSGFCLMIPYAAGDTPTLATYIRRRFAKIVPSYYLALIFVALVFPFSGFIGPNPLADTTLHALFLHGIAQPLFVSLNGNFWSLAVEIEFYCIFPVLASLMLLNAWASTIVAVLFSVGYALAIHALAVDQIFVYALQLPSVLVLFTLGMLTAYVHEKCSARLNAAALSLCLSSFALLACLFWACAQSGGGAATWAWENVNHLFLAIALGGFTLGALRSPAIVQRLIGNRVLRFFGDISYNVYLWNAVIMAWILRGVWPNAISAVVVYAVACVLLGWILTRLFERPLMRKINA